MATTIPPTSNEPEVPDPEPLMPEMPPIPEELGAPGEPEGNNPVPEPVDTDLSEASPGATSDPPIEIPQAPEINWELAGEALACITGLFPKKPITPEMGRKAEGVIDDIGILVRKFCRFLPFDKFSMPDPVDFEETYAKLMPLSDDEIRIATEDLVSPDLIGSWTETINRGRAFIREQWPLAIRETPTGPEWNDPSRTEGGRVRAMLEVGNDCRELLREMNRGTMSPSQIQTAQITFPSLFARLTQSMDLGLADAGARGKKCPWSHELMVRSLANLAPVNLMTFGPSEQGEPPAKTGEIRIEFDRLLTRNQSVD